VGTALPASSAAGIDPPSAGGRIDSGTLFARLSTAARTKPTVKITAVAPGVATDGLFTYRATGADAALRMTANGVTLSVKLVAGVVYIGPGQVVMGKHRVRIDPAETNPQINEVSALVQELVQVADPKAGMIATDPARKWSTSIGPVLDGVPTVAFSSRLTGVQARQLAQRLKVTPATAQSAVASASATSTDDVGPDGLPRKILAVVVDSGRSATVTRLYSSWAASTTIEPPPAADTVPSSQTH
jgi:hypothetical protein